MGAWEDHKNMTDEDLIAKYNAEASHVGSWGLTWWMDMITRRENDRQTKEMMEMNSKALELAQTNLEVAKKTLNIAKFSMWASIVAVVIAVVALIPSLVTVFNFIFK